MTGAGVSAEQAAQWVAGFIRGGGRVSRAGLVEDAPVDPGAREALVLEAVEAGVRLPVRREYPLVRSPITGWTLDLDNPYLVLQIDRGAPVKPQGAV